MRIAIALAFTLLPALAQPADLAVVDRVKAEAFERSKVMDTLRNLTDVHGPRLTGSAGFEDAARWAMQELNRYGLQKVHTEKWGPFGVSWTLEQSSVELLQPRYASLDASPLAWSTPTSGLVTGEVVLAPLRAAFREGPAKYKEALENWRKEWSGKLRGKIVLLSKPQVPASQTNPQFRRYTAAELADIATAATPAILSTAKTLSELKWPEDASETGRFFGRLPNHLMEQLYDLYDQAAADRGAMLSGEGVLGVLILDERAHEGMAFAEAAGSFRHADTHAPPTFVVTAEQYNRIARLAENKEPVRVRLGLAAAMGDHDGDGLNIIGDIPGTGDHKDELVMIGAHFDSWHTGTGATDNGAGSAVMIEVMRILKALNLKLDRTVRIGLWGGEEQGLFGSRAYVKEHFADPLTMKTTSEHAKLSGYFNLDNGSGKIRGVYLQGHDAMRPIFESWLAPFRDLGVTTVSIRNTGGTDHLSFNAVGLPGFQFIQDPLDYSTITHHSSMDTWDHAVPEDLMQASAVIASLVYETANRKEMLPRRELPKPVR
jgi:carboxypeptidase Q